MRNHSNPRILAILENGQMNEDLPMKDTNPKKTWIKIHPSVMIYQFWERPRGSLSSPSLKCSTSGGPLGGVQAVACFSMWRFFCWQMLTAPPEVERLELEEYDGEAFVNFPWKPRVSRVFFHVSQRFRCFFLHTFLNVTHPKMISSKFNHSVGQVRVSVFIPQNPIARCFLVEKSCCRRSFGSWENLPELLRGIFLSTGKRYNLNNSAHLVDLVDVYILYIYIWTR